MSSRHKEVVKKELEKIYDKNSKSLRYQFTQSLKNNPKLNLLLRLMIIANIGIWASLALLVFKSF